jgi:hypothetical protein
VREEYTLTARDRQWVNDTKALAEKPPEKVNQLTEEQVLAYNKKLVEQYGQ